MATRPRARACILHKTLGLMLYPVTFRDEIVSTVGVATQTRHVDREHTPGTSTQEVGAVGNQRLGNGLVAVTGGNM